MAQPNARDSKLADSLDNPQIAERGASLTAITAPTNYAAHASGAVAVVSNAATDLDTTAAALDTLEDELTVLVTRFNSLIERLEAHGLIADN